ncbi:MAG TPA: carboxypeptidase-like regulatory domain-containing protein, partial [Pyrinomonadaceae bacterium]|nr:carboxypeptidase-like regulatory domain-containing protein [Pyrinomonadaceae bacterium]
MKRFLTAFLLVGFVAVAAFAQGTTGGLSGTVSGPDGALPGATVLVTDTKTGKEITVTTNEEGFYNVPQLEFGTYTVRITANGFKTLVANELKVDVGRVANLSPTLEIGDVSAEVVVTAGADIVTADTAQVSNTVSPQQILSLPLLARNPLALTGLQAGVSANSAQLTTINGMRTTFTNITRDGINIQDTFIRSNATDFAPGRPSVDDTGEFTIVTSNQEADQGYGGAQIRLVTPRGTKDFHGALFAYNRNSAFAANTFFNNRAGRYLPTDSEVVAGRQVAGTPRTPKPFRNRNQFGGKASWKLPVPGFGEGVPQIYWDKAYFFFAYEGIRDPVTATATRTILSESARAGTFTYNRTAAGSPINTTVNGATVACPSGSAGSVCTISNFLQYAQGTLTIPAGQPPIRSTTSPLIQQYLNTMPTASNFTGGDGLNTRGYRLLRGSDQNRDQYSMRFDVDIDDKNTFNIVYNYNDELNLRPDVDTSGFTAAPDVDQTSKNKQFTGAYRHVFNSNIVNEVRGGFFGSEVPFNRLSPIGDYILAVPLVTSPMQFLNQGRNTKAFNIQDNADWIWGDHTFRFGGQMQIFRVNAYNDAQIYPLVTVGSGTNTPNFAQSSFTALGGINTTQLATANGLLALLGGHYTNVTQFFNKPDLGTPFQRLATEFRAFRYENNALYVADRWQAMKGLTLNLGVRWEMFPALRNNTGNALEPVITDPDNPIPS